MFETISGELINLDMWLARVKAEQDDLPLGTVSGDYRFVSTHCETIVEYLKICSMT